jgi:transposase-like protein
MTKSTVAKKLGSRDEDWRTRISAQERSGASVKQFCRQHGLTEQSFYYWRKRLQTPASMRFALVEAEPRRGTADHGALELVLTTGERLRISAGVDAATLRQVLEALRA